MASIRLRNNGKFCVQIRKKGCPSKSKTFSSLKEATSWAKEAEKFACPRAAKESVSKHTLLSVGKKYCDIQLRGKSSRHLMMLRYERMAKHFPQPFLSISRTDIQAYKTLRLEQVSGSTVREEIQSIKKLFRWADREMIFGNREVPSPGQNISLPPASKPRTRIVERDELDALMSELDTNMREIVELAYETAMRRAEITKLLPRHINLEERTLLVEDGKTGDRLVPLTKRAVELLRVALRRCFTAESRLYPVAPHSVSTAVRRARRRAGLGDHVRMHQLRHTRITEVAKRGFSLAQIMIVSGHRDARSAQRYTHLSVKDVIDLID